MEATRGDWKAIGKGDMQASDGRIARGAVLVGSEAEAMRRGWK